jgi:hypothetical protein
MYLALRAIKSWFLDSPFCNLVTMLTELYFVKYRLSQVLAKVEASKKMFRCSAVSQPQWEVSAVTGLCQMRLKLNFLNIYTGTFPAKFDTNMILYSLTSVVPLLVWITSFYKCANYAIYRLSIMFSYLKSNYNFLTCVKIFPYKQKHTNQFRCCQSCLPAWNENTGQKQM